MYPAEISATSNLIFLEPWSFFSSSLRSKTIKLGLYFDASAKLKHLTIRLLLSESIGGILLSHSGDLKLQRGANGHPGGKSQGSTADPGIAFGRYALVVALGTASSNPRV